MTAQQLREKISAWLSDKTNHEGDLVDFLVDKCGVVYEYKWEEEEEEEDRPIEETNDNCIKCGTTEKLRDYHLSAIGQTGIVKTCSPCGRTMTTEFVLRGVECGDDCECRNEEEDKPCEVDRCDAIGKCSLDKCFYEEE